MTKDELIEKNRYINVDWELIGTKEYCADSVNGWKHWAYRLS